MLSVLENVLTVYMLSLIAQATFDVEKKDHVGAKAWQPPGCHTRVSGCLGRHLRLSIDEHRPGIITKHQGLPSREKQHGTSKLTVHLRTSSLVLTRPLLLLKT